MRGHSCSSDVMGYGSGGRKGGRGACFQCGIPDYHACHCPLSVKGGGKSSGKGQDAAPTFRRMAAQDGSQIPTSLPMLPGPREPSNEETGKWKVIIHTAGMKHLRNAGGREWCSAKLVGVGLASLFPRIAVAVQEDARDALLLLASGVRRSLEGCC